MELQEATIGKVISSMGTTQIALSDVVIGICFLCKFQSKVLHGIKPHINTSLILSQIPRSSLLTKFMEST